MFKILKQKRILIPVAILLLLGAGASAYFVVKNANQQSSHSPSTSTSSSKKNGNSQSETSDETNPEDKKEASKNEKKPEAKPGAGNMPSQSQTGGGGQSSGGSSGGGGPTTPQSELLGWRLTAQNTGLAPHGLSCNSLPPYTGSGKPASGTVISQKRIQTTLDLSDGNITIEKSCIRPTSAGLGLPILTTTDYNDCNPDCAVAPNPVTVRDSEIDGSLLSAQESAFATGFIGIGSFYRNYIHGLGSGIAIANAGQSFNTNIEGNYVTGLTAYGDPSTPSGNHSDAFTIRDFITTSNPNRRALVKNNRFDCNSGNDTGAIFIQQTWNDNIDYVTIEGNLLEGGGYQLQLEGNTYGTHIVAINNRFSGTGYGPAAKAGSGPGWGTWTSNYINNPSAANNQGVVVSEPN